MSMTRKGAQGADDEVTWATIGWRLTKLVFRGVGRLFSPWHRRVWLVPVALFLLVADRAPHPVSDILGLLAILVAVAWYLVIPSISGSFVWAGKGILCRVCPEWLFRWVNRLDIEWVACQAAKRAMSEFGGALEAVGLEDSEVVAAKTTQVGQLVTVTIPAGKTREQVERTAPALRECLGALALLPDRTNETPRVVTFNRVMLDILAHPLTGAAPVTDGRWDTSLGARTWIEIGVDQQGRPLRVPVFLSKSGGVRVLIAGASGSGKNSPVTQLLVGCVKLGPQAVRLWLGDPKATELAPFIPWADRYATEPADLVAMLEDLQTEMRRRQAYLAAKGAQLWNDQTDGPVIVFVLDELSAITADLGDRDLKARAERALADLAARTRSVGISLVFITQSPYAEVVLPVVRNNLDIRIGLRVLTSAMAEIVMPGSTTDGLGSPDQIRGEYDQDGALSCAGVFYLAGLGPRVQGRSYFIPGSTVPEILASVPHLPKQLPAPESAPAPPVADPEPAPDRPLRARGERRPRRATTTDTTERR